MEKKQLAVPVSEGEGEAPDPSADVVTVDGKPPMLRVDDPRLDSSEIRDAAASQGSCAVR